MNTSRCVVTDGTRHALTIREYPDPYCDRHVPAALAAEAAELDRRSKITLGAHGWPYGPNVSIPSRRALLDWAEGNRLRLAGGSCLHWLRKGQCSSCVGNREFWLDHVTGWARNGKPAVLIAQPYGVSEQSIADLAQLAVDPALMVRIDGTGWYGVGTTFIQVWRADALPETRAA